MNVRKPVDYGTMHRELTAILTQNLPQMDALRKIGNNFRIRHHERDTIDISDPRHYDYFFNRCLSLIALAIQYLQ